MKEMTDKIIDALFQAIRERYPNHAEDQFSYAINIFKSVDRDHVDRDHVLEIYRTLEIWYPQTTQFGISIGEHLLDTAYSKPQIHDIDLTEPDSTDKIFKIIDDWLAEK